MICPSNMENTDLLVNGHPNIVDAKTYTCSRLNKRRDTFKPKVGEKR